MHIRHNVSLRDFSTMRLGGLAAHLTQVTNQTELLEAIKWAKSQGKPAVMIGGGSNIVWRDEGYPGLVIVNKIRGYQQKDDDNQALITVGSGEIWDDLVAKATKQGFSGIESLSLIPGTVGATPVQNVGAYGQEIADTLVELTAYDSRAAKMVTLKNADCNFSYRSSRFKTTDRGRFFITSVTLRLKKGEPTPPFYPALQQYLDAHNITRFTPQAIREAVVAIRQAKLPDPAAIANNGSFFANPIVDTAQLETLHRTYATIPHWPVTEEKVKISAAWLVQEAGFKNYHDPETGMATWATQPLVLVNEHATSTKQLLKFKQKIVGVVKKKFGITLEQEPELF